MFSVQGFSVQECKDNPTLKSGGSVDKTYMDVEDLNVYQRLCKLHKECIRMLNGLEKSLEKHLPESERRWTA